MTTFEEKVRTERERQIAKGYDADHDDVHGIRHIAMWMCGYAERGEHVKAAALALAASELIERNHADGSAA